MKLKRLFAAALVLLIAALMMPDMRVYALSDLDFTVNVDTTVEYVSGYEVEAPIIIKTQNEKGYIELTMLLKYNDDVFECSTIFEDHDGFSTEKVDEGLQIKYKSSDGTPTKAASEYTLNIKFAVRTGVASGVYPLELVVKEEDVYSLDSNGNKENGKLTVSDAKIKELTVVETNDDNVTQPTEDGGDPNFYIAGTSQSQDVQSGGGCVGGWIIGIIITALLAFVGGVVVGFILCQKRMTEDGYQAAGFGQRPSGAQSNFGSGGSQRKSIYDNDDADRSYSKYAQSGVSRRPSMVDEDELVDTDYFGRSAERGRFTTESGSASGFETDDDDSGFPNEFIPRNYGGQSDDRTAFGTPGKRERNDDGYGSFESDDSDYRSDRRRYR